MTEYSLTHSKHKLFSDSGSTEAQITFLNRRVIQLSWHLRIHKKDYSSKIGLRKILGARKRLLSYLYKQDRTRYIRLINHLGIRNRKDI